MPWVIRNLAGKGWNPNQQSCKQRCYHMDWQGRLAEQRSKLATWQLKKTKAPRAQSLLMIRSPGIGWDFPCFRLHPYRSFYILKGFHARDHIGLVNLAGSGLHENNHRFSWIPGSVSRLVVMDLVHENRSDLPWHLVMFVDVSCTPHHRVVQSQHTDIDP